MPWRLVCPACGHFVNVGKVRGGGKVFACPCGITLTAQSTSDLKDKLARLTKKIHTTKVLNKFPRDIRPRTPARFVQRATEKHLSIFNRTRARIFSPLYTYNRGGCPPQNRG